MESEWENGRTQERKSGRAEEWKQKEDVVLPFFHSSVLPFGGSREEKG
jgi:hypothetical protein